jgi:hypothetical protein
MDQEATALAGVLLGGGIAIASNLAAATYSARAQRRQYILEARRADYREFFRSIDRLISKEVMDQELVFDAFSRVDALADDEHMGLLAQLRNVLEEFCSTPSADRRAELRKELFRVYPEVKKALRGEILT